MIESTITEPICWDDDLRMWRVSGHHEASTVLRGAGWSSDPRHSPLVSPAVRDLPAGALMFTDPPDHTRLRKIVGPAFTPAAIERLRPRVAAIVESALDGLLDADTAAAAEVDLLAEFARPLTLAVIAELLDLGVEGAALFARHSSELARLMEIDAGPRDLAAAATAIAELTLFLTPLLAERRDEPAADFISALLAFSDRPDGIGLDEVLPTCIVLLAAGHDTTAHVITNSTLALLREPEQLPALFEDPARAVEELLRLEGSARLAGRTALVEHTLAGRTIPAGTTVAVDLWQANRDPRRWPGGLDLSREPAGHLAFGAGPHFCLGASLARLELIEALTGVFRRFPRLALTGAPIRRSRSRTFHSLHELPVRLGPAAGEPGPPRDVDQTTADPARRARTSRGVS